MKTVKYIGCLIHYVAALLFIIVGVAIADGSLLMCIAFMLLGAVMLFANAACGSEFMKKYEASHPWAYRLFGDDIE